MKGPGEKSHTPLCGVFNGILAGLLAVVVALGAPAPAAAADDAAGTQTREHCFLFSPQELSLRFAYGDSDLDSLRSYTLGPRVAYDLPDWIPAIAGNRLRLALEINGSIFDGNENSPAGEFAFSPLIFDYRYDAGGFFVPFVDGGEGIVLTTLRNLRLGGPFEFSSQAGGGVHLFYTHEDAITVAARYRHMSNSGIKDENHGLNTLFVIVGFSHFPDRK